MTEHGLIIANMTRTIYALRCPTTNEVRYIGLTRNPKARRAMHRSRKKQPRLPVDIWTNSLAETGRRVKWQTIVVIRDEFATVAVAAEEAIIAKLKRLGHNLLNADLDAMRRRKREPMTFDPRIVALLLRQ